MLSRTVNKSLALLLAWLLLLSVPACGSADFGSNSKMVSPADLVLVPASAVNSRFWVSSGNYTWSYNPDGRADTGTIDAGLTAPEALASAGRLKLPDSSAFTLSWDNGWAPDEVSVRMWSADAVDHPEQADDFLLGEKDLSDGRIVLEPGWLCRFTAVWEKDHGHEENGRADYYVITEQMTDQEAAEARARADAPFTEEDLELLTLKIGSVECILGITTPQDLIDQGLYYDFGFEGDYTFRTDPEQLGEVYVFSEGNAPDRPITLVNAYWADDVPLEYCGFDGRIRDVDTDPDNIWLPEDERWTEEDLLEAAGEDGESETGGCWSGMICWMYSRFHVEMTSDGIYSAVVTLSNGRELSISSHDSPVSLQLLRENAFRPGDDADPENDI